MPVRASSKIQSAGLLLFRQREKDVQLRAAFGEMSVLDQHCRAPSFGGPPPEIVPLRHPTFARTYLARSRTTFTRHVRAFQRSLFDSDHNSHGQGGQTMF